MIRIKQRFNYIILTIKYNLVICWVLTNSNLFSLFFKNIWKNQELYLWNHFLPKLNHLLSGNFNPMILLGADFAMTKPLRQMYQVKHKDLSLKSNKLFIKRKEDFSFRMMLNFGSIYQEQVLSISDCGPITVSS